MREVTAQLADDFLFVSELLPRAIFPSFPLAYHPPLLPTVREKKKKGIRFSFVAGFSPGNDDSIPKGWGLRFRLRRRLGNLRSLTYGIWSR